MPARALVFDVFGTLVDWRSGVSRAFSDAGLPGDPTELADAWRARYQPILDEVNDGTRPWGDLDELHTATLDALLGERGLDLAAHERQRLVGAWHRLDPWPDVRAGLDELHRSFVTAALSNGHTALLIDLARFGGLRWDAVLSAQVCRHYKPAPQVYLMAAELLGVPPPEIMLVAAHPADLAAARAVGLCTALIDRPREFGAATGSRRDPDADHTCATLTELAAALSR